MFEMFKKKDGNASTFPGAKKLLAMKDILMEYVSISKKDTSEVKNYSVVFITDCNEAGMNPTFSVVGGQEEIIEMFYSAALNDEHFGKILVTATEAAIYKDKELADLQRQLKSADSKMGRMTGKGKKKGMSLDDLKDMSPEDIINLAKRMAEDRDDD